jgi:peptidoglycan hydrolase-like protein with peptidoglycan-binding domain
MKKKQRNMIIAGVGVLIAGVVGYSLFFPKRSSKYSFNLNRNPTSTGSSNISTQTPIYTPSYNQTYLSTDEIKLAQIYLNQNYNAGLVVDGVAGSLTNTAVQRTGKTLQQIVQLAKGLGPNANGNASSNGSGGSISDFWLNGDLSGIDVHNIHYAQ